MSIYTANGISLRDDVPGRLEVRPEELRQPGYENCYDYKTLIYDCFISNSELVVVGPPLVNLEQKFFPAKVFAFNKQNQYQYFPLDRCYSIHSNLDHASHDVEPRKLKMNDAYLDFFQKRYIEIGEENRTFEGKRVLFTLQKNNPVEWIVSWIEFYIKVHKTNAVLIYDNASTAYSLESLHQALTSIKGLDVLALVDWRYPYGPGSWVKDGKQVSSWDSNFCQHGALESAKKRFLRNAKSVISVDIDELIVSTQSEHTSIHEFTEASDFECVIVDGEFVSNATSKELELEPRTFRHNDFKHTFLEPLRSNPKYCIVPARSAVDAQWSVHIAGLKPQKQDIFALRHFLAINNNWKYQRSRPCTIDVEKHVLDLCLDKAFQDNRIFCGDR